MAYACAVLPRSLDQRRRLGLILALCMQLLACSRSAEPNRKRASAIDRGVPDTIQSGSVANLSPPSFFRYPGKSGAIEPWVQEQVEVADAAHLRVLVYVGASWCEPCRHFHEAVERGELNGTLNGLRFLEFDQDRDASALKVAGYVYQYIPVLALPDPDGRNHGHMISGSIKGPEAVKRNLVPRLQALLAGSAVD